MRLQVARQSPQIPGHCPEGSNLFEAFPATLATSDGAHNGLAVHIESGYVAITNVHDIAPKQGVDSGDVKGG
ncbi:MAG: hypothetical protein ACFCD0_11470 [Gemmataceae bacterium]